MDADLMRLPSAEGAMERSRRRYTRPLHRRARSYKALVYRSTPDRQSHPWPFPTFRLK
jgi:hypothetical protein